MFGVAAILTAATLVAGLGVGLVAQVFAGTKSAVGECATPVAHTSALLERTLFEVLPAATLRAVDGGQPARLDYACTGDDSPAGFDARWNGTTGAASVRLLQGDGWRRTDPAGGPPRWYLREEPADGNLDVPTSGGDPIVLNKELDGRRFGAFVDRVGISAWVE